MHFTRQVSRDKRTLMRLAIHGDSGDSFTHVFRIVNLDLPGFTAENPCD